MKMRAQNVSLVCVLVQNDIIVDFPLMEYSVQQVIAVASDAGSVELGFTE